MLNSSEIRELFYKFFQNKGHIYAPMHSIVCDDDPTLMFTNAGMNQFKDIFLGNKTTADKRLVNSQLCLRVTGKHNDLDEVGTDTYHHTLFEMLGNWSMGDYFKKEAITWAFELLTKVYGINPGDMYATVFGGDKTYGLDTDIEAQNVWRKLLPEDHILYGDKHDNFWEMGDIGPCGPCSEIHVDIRSDKSKMPGQELVNKGNPQVIELWNIVFMQYERTKSGELKPLKHNYIDTGMGFERLAMVLQGKQSNYDSDIFTPYIDAICRLTNTQYGIDDKIDIAIRVVADHIRAVTVAIADGAIPSNVREGYVIRRILRRAIRYNYSFLGGNVPTLYKLVPVVVSQYKTIKPNLIETQERISKTIMQEEYEFLKTLSLGINRLNTIIDKNKTNISGEVVFELHDTYGFPVDLTEVILREHNITYGHNSYERALAQQRQRSRTAAVVCESDWTIINDIPQQFIGYDHLSANTNILRYRTCVTKGETQYHIVFAQCPFYGQGGGQIGDTGFIKTQDGDTINIIDTQKQFEIIYVITDRLPKTIDPNSLFFVQVDSKRRHDITCNHTATHLLHSALRQVLGNEVKQCGSLVSNDKLRFDFTYSNSVSVEQQYKVESIINDKIQNDILALDECRDVDYELAKASGAIGLFENKYGNKVRVISYGEYSKELCCGTHVHSTNEIIGIKILNISSIANGVRRVEAITGNALLEYYEQRDNLLKNIEHIMSDTKDVLKTINKLIYENESMNDILKKYYKKEITDIVKGLLSHIHTVQGINIIAQEVVTIGIDCTPIVNEVIKRKNDVIVFLCQKGNNNVISIGTGLSTYSASEIANRLIPILQAKGGGNKKFARLITSLTVQNVLDLIMNNINKVC